LRARKRRKETVVYLIGLSATKKEERKEKRRNLPHPPTSHLIHQPIIKRTSRPSVHPPIHFIQKPHQNIITTITTLHPLSTNDISASTLLSSANMSAVDFTAKQQTATALLPVGGEWGQVKHHKSAAGLAVGGGASEGRLEEVSELVEKKCQRNGIPSHPFLSQGRKRTYL
jgi:hypothetical protein